MTKQTTQQITQYAQKALLYEVLLSPKPGLVDRFNSGSHKDMDIYTFIEAIQALTPYYSEYVQLGFHHSESPKELFEKARLLGVDAEIAMMKATNEVNTHKGANFTFALVLSAIGYLIKENQVSLPFEQEDTESLFRYVAQMSEGLVSKDFKHLEHKERLSYGEKLYKNYGITGIRGVAESGYPVIPQIALPYLRTNIKKYPQHKEEVFLHLLALIMSESEDTNLIHRGGVEAYQSVQSEAAEIYKKTTPLTIKEAFSEYNQRLIQRHLSPGGSADLLALSLFIAQLEVLF